MDHESHLRRSSITRRHRLYARQPSSRRTLPLPLISSSHASPSPSPSPSSQLRSSHLPPAESALPACLLHRDEEYEIRRIDATGRASSNRHLRAHRLLRQPITEKLDLVRTRGHSTAVLACIIMAAKCDSEGLYITLSFYLFVFLSSSLVYSLYISFFPPSEFLAYRSVLETRLCARPETVRRHQEAEDAQPRGVETLRVAGDLPYSRFFSSSIASFFILLQYSSRRSSWLILPILFLILLSNSESL